MHKILNKLKKRDEGSFMSISSVIVTIIFVAMLLIGFMSWMSNIDRKTAIDGIARRYILAMETTGYLTEEQESALLIELEKAGVENITKNLAQRLPNLKICALAPNWVNTDSVLEMDKNYLEEELKRVGQEKLLKKEEVALKIIEIIINDDIRSGEIIRMGGLVE